MCIEYVSVSLGFSCLQILYGVWILVQKNVFVFECDKGDF